MKIKAIRTGIFKEGGNLQRFFIFHIPAIKEGSILVITSKIVALAENRTAALKEKERIIKKETEWILPTKYAPLTIRDGMLMASAGVDESNAQGRLILLPKDSYATAARLHTSLRKHYKVKKLGILITDSRTFPLRAGAVGVALGYAGFYGVKDYKGSSDIFGRPLKITVANVADSLASATVLLMGEGNEQKPFAVIEDAPVTFSNKINRKELVVPLKDDLYAPLFRNGKFKK